VHLEADNGREGRGGGGWRGGHDQSDVSGGE
jgi:hypothetical protein